jgi:SNF2 family DNA or RNA helicase
MARILKDCPYCKKPQPSYQVPKVIAGNQFLTLSCGHTVVHKLATQKDYHNLILNDGRKLRDYQAESCEFAEKANFRVLIAHEPGLGKTIISLALLREHNEELLPCGVVVKPTLLQQWFREIVSATGMVPQIIRGREKPLPEFFKVFLISRDLLRNADWLETIPVKSIIIDECQGITNPDSQRTNAVRKLCKGRDAVIALSGTPIKNNAGEYFPVLNLLQPERFGSYTEYLSHWVNTSVGAYGVKARGLAYPEEFKAFTQDFIIRKTRVEAAPELPTVDRQFRYVELEENLSAYQKEMEVFEEAYLSQEGGDFTDVQNSLFRLKHLVGLDKVEAAVDFASEFLIGTDRKLTIFVHHQDVGQLIYTKLSELCKDGGFEKPLRITSDMDSDARGKAARNFQEESKYRLLIASTLSAGEGLNLQACSDCLFVERQWNPANEEQAEGRFVRLGSTADKVSATYLTVLGTIDEMLMELVEEKRKIVASTLDFTELESSDNILKELADTLFSKGLKQWKTKK